MAKFIGIKLIIFSLLICTLIQHCRCVTKNLSINFFPYTNGRFDEKAVLKVFLDEKALREYQAYDPSDENKLYKILNADGVDANADVVLIPVYLSIAEQIASPNCEGLDGTKNILFTHLDELKNLSKNRRIILVGYSQISNVRFVWKILNDVIQTHKQLGTREISSYIKIFCDPQSTIGANVGSELTLNRIPSNNGNWILKLDLLLPFFAGTEYKTRITVYDVSDGHFGKRAVKLPIRMTTEKNSRYKNYRSDLMFPGGGSNKLAAWFATSVGETVKLLESDGNKEELCRMVNEFKEKENNPEMKVYLLSYKVPRNGSPKLIEHIISQFIHAHKPANTEVAICGFTDKFKSLDYKDGLDGASIDKFEIANLDKVFQKPYTFDSRGMALQIHFFWGNVFDPEEKLSIPIKMMKTNKKMFDPDGAKYSIVEPGSTSDLLVLIIKWDNIKSLFSSQGDNTEQKKDLEIYLATLIREHGNLEVQVWGAQNFQTGPQRNSQKHIDSFIKTYTVKCGRDPKSFIITYFHTDMKRAPGNNEEEWTDYLNTDLDKFLSNVGQADAPRLKRESAEANPVPKLQQ